MKRQVVVALAAGFLGTTFLGMGRAQAFPSLHEIVCDALEADPGFWAAYGALQAAKASGLVTSEMQCLDLGDTIGDFGIPDGTYKDCLCEKINWPPVNPPVCSDPHNACTTGGPLNESTSMMSCQASVTENIAGKVCQFDNYCCNFGWDSICEAEAATAFWSSMDAEQQSIVMRTDLTCDQKNQNITTLQQEVNSDTGQLPCLGTKTYPFACMGGYSFEHTFNGECMGVSAGNMTNGTAIISWPCNAQPPAYTAAKDQAWVTDLSDCIAYNGTSYCSVRDSVNFGKCLGVKAGITSNGTSLMIWDCLGQTHPDQYWSINKQSDNNYYFIDLASAKAGQSYGVHYNGTKSTFTLSTASASTELPVTQ